MTCGISIRSWFFLLHNRFPETNVLERYISFAVCLSLLKQNKRTGACKPFKSAVTNRFLKKQTWPFQFGSRSKTSRFLTRTAALRIWRAPLGFAVVFGAQPRPFRRRHRKLFTRPFSSQLFALSGERDCFHAEEMTNSLSSSWANQIAEKTKVSISPNRVAASKVNGTKFKCTFFYGKLWTKITCHVCVIHVHDPEYSCSVEILLGFILNSR